VIITATQLFSVLNQIFWLSFFGLEILYSYCTIYIRILRVNKLYSQEIRITRDEFDDLVMTHECIGARNSRQWPHLDRRCALCARSQVASWHEQLFFLGFSFYSTQILSKHTQRERERVVMYPPLTFSLYGSVMLLLFQNQLIHLEFIVWNSSLFYVKFIISYYLSERIRSSLPNNKNWWTVYPTWASDSRIAYLTCPLCTNRKKKSRFMRRNALLIVLSLLISQYQYRMFVRR